MFKPEPYIFDRHTEGDVHTSSLRAEHGKEPSKGGADSVSSLRAATGFGLLALEMDEFIDHYQRASDKAVSRSARATAGDEQERTTWQIPSKPAEKSKGKTGETPSWLGSLKSTFSSSTSPSASADAEREALLKRISDLERQLTEAGLTPNATTAD